MSKLVVKTTKIVAPALESGEQVLAATRVMPRGGIRRAGTGALGGAIGAAIAVATATEQSHGEMELPTKAPMVLAVTDRRLLSVGVSLMSGGPKDYLGAVALSELVSCTADESRSVGMKMIAVELEFRNGSSLSVEVPRAFLTDGHSFVDTLRSRLA